MTGYIRASSLRWLSSLLTERYGCDVQLEEAAWGVLRLSLGGEARSITFDADPLMFARADSELPCETWEASDEGWVTPIAPSLPAPGASVLTRPLVVATGDGFHIGYDVPGLVYWMLTRQEEVGRTDLDRHQRFAAVSSHAHRHGYLERPIVDEWLHVVGQVMEKAWPGIKLSPLVPSMRVSHDVDTPSRYAFIGVSGLLRSVAGDVLRRRNFSRLARAPRLWLDSRDRIHPDDPYNTFDWLMDRSEERGLRSAFYFICGRTDRSKDAAYEVGDPRIRSLMRRIHERGHEIGLHPSYGTYHRPDLIASEAQTLRRVCEEEGIQQSDWGGRMHFLRWETPTTMNGWEQAGMAYDSTMSYADRPGFRCGTCHEYQAYDPVNARPLELRIRPLVAMECTVMAPRYLGLNAGPEALEKFVQLKRACEAVGGCFTTLWHNTFVQEQGQRDLYSALLAA